MADENIEQIIQRALRQAAQGGSGESAGTRASRIAQERRDIRFGRNQEAAFSPGGGGGAGTAGLTAFQPGLQGLLQSVAESGGFGPGGGLFPPSGAASAIRGREVAGRPENIAQQLQLELLQEQVDQAQRAGRPGGGGPAISQLSGGGGGGGGFSRAALAPTGGGLSISPELQSGGFGGGSRRATPSGASRNAAIRAGRVSRIDLRRRRLENQALEDEIRSARERQEEELGFAKRAERREILQDRLKGENQKTIRRLLSRFFS